MARKSTQALLLIGVLLAGSACAQSAPPMPSGSIPPPPDLDQPVQPQALPPQPPPPTPAQAASALRASLAPTLPPHDAMGQPPPTVSVRKVQGDVVEEYRAGGNLLMIRIIPRHGPVQTFYANAQGRLQRNEHEGPVQPVFYTIYQWGH
ncbi:MAG: DUF2782 domain-containing protein [Metallibacterium scheffleri]|jgi:hypothetical protein